MTRSFQRAQNQVKTRSVSSVEKVRRRNTEKVRRSKTVLILSHYRIFGPVGKSKVVYQKIVSRIFGPVGKSKAVYQKIVFFGRGNYKN